jgi:isocitrate dehydrogenase kinase/phosphatase
MNKTTLTKPAAGKTNLAVQFRVLRTDLARQKVEIDTLRRQIAEITAEAKALKESPSWKRVQAYKDRQIVALEGDVRTALRFAGLRSSSVELEIDPSGSSQNPSEAYAAAIESGDRKGAAEIFAAHKSELFRK